MKRFTRWRLSLLLVIMAFILSGCGEPYLSSLRPAGEVAKKQFHLMLLSTAIMVLVILVVTTLFVIVLIRFRRKDDRIPEQVEGSHKLEVIWTVIPIILILILALPTVKATLALGNMSGMEDEDAVVVNVRASLYWWEFEYPNEGIVTSQELVVPTDEKIFFNLTASDVKHSFWVPALGGTLDTNTDNVNTFWLQIDSDAAEEAGNLFYGKCAELCGPSHALMDSKVRAVSRDEYDRWIKGMKAAKEPQKPETALAKKGEEIFNEKGCISCHAVTSANSTIEAARIGPNLTDFGERAYVVGILQNNKEELKKWLKNPESVKPANKMTGTYEELTEEELDALAEYLLSLKVTE